jgi:hypothetical protein
LFAVIEGDPPFEPAIAARQERLSGREQSGLPML